VEVFSIKKGQRHRVSKLQRERDFMKLYSIETENFMLDGGTMFGVVPKVLWQKLYPADGNNLCNWAMRCLLAVDGDRKILLDTGIGDKLSEKFLWHYHLNGEHFLEQSLAEIDTGFDDITDVIVSHLHFDHCGGNTRYKNSKLEPAFKNANYWIGKSQWETAMNPSRLEKASFLKEDFVPLKKSGQLRLVEEDKELYPNVTVRLYNGHTDGQLLTFITWDNRTVVYVADLLPSMAHIPLPYIMSFDLHPLVTLKEKEEFLKEAVQNDFVLFLLTISDLRSEKR
jgi:glyoxylase-like metal-dependent hydrolase (beta-lactamase superfamily II)